MDHSVVALSACRVAFFDHKQLVDITTRFPHLTRLLWLLTTIDAAIQRTWITSLGRRSAVSHFVHLVCELFERLQVVGLTRGMSFTVPFTQTELADMLGLSTVHVNRTLQEVRKTNLLEWEGSLVTIRDKSALWGLAEFDPTYLNLFNAPR